MQERTEMRPDSGAAEKFGPPDWSLLRDGPTDEPPVFPVDLLGEAGEWIKGAAKGTGAPVDYVAGALLCATSSLIGYAVEVAIIDSWREAPLIWAFLIGPPGSGKTPAAQPCLDVLTAIEHRWGEQHQNDVSGKAIDLEQRILAAEDNERKALEHELQEVEDQRQNPPRLIIQDATVEALCHVELAAKQGLLVYQDELAALLTNTQRYGGDSRAFYLQAWNGKSHRVDRRKSGGSILVPRHGFSLLGGIQPDRLQSLLLDNADDDGFAARALLFWPEVSMTYQPPSDFVIDPMKRAMQRLADVPNQADGQPRRLALNEKGRATFQAWQEDHHREAMVAAGKLGSAFGKFPGYVARLAGVIAVLRWAWRVEDSDFPTEVDASCVDAAVALVKQYFKPQAVRVYQGLELAPAERLARDFLLVLRKRGLRRFNAREAWRSWGVAGAHAQGANRLRRDALEALEEARWIVPSTPTGPGRPRDDWDVNPLLFRDKAEDKSRAS